MSATITVKEGGLVGALGGTASTSDSSARVIVPAGAAPSEQAITVTRLASPPPHARLVAGTAYTFATSGQLAAPVSIRISFASSPGGDTTRFRLHRLRDGSWEEVPASTVDIATTTVRGVTPSLGTFAIVALPPLPVFSVTLSHDSATLVPEQTVQLTATPRDESGGALRRAVAWRSTAPGVATVSADGLITAVAAGRTTISATSEGKSQAAIITVKDGGLVGPTGGTIASADGNARVDVPAGALSTAQAITIAPIANPTPSGLMVPGTAWDFGPSQTFSQPVTMTIRFTAALLPPNVAASSLRLHRLTNGVWVAVPGSSVDVAAGTVAATTSSFSSYAILGSLPVQQIVITWDYGVGATCSSPLPCGLGTFGQWTVPPDVYTVTFELYGAGGGGLAGAGKGRGKGGKTTATLTVIPGEVLQVRLGAPGTLLTGFNGGGHGGFGWGSYATPTGTVNTNGSGGGGATDVRRGIPYFVDVPGQPIRLAVAGGGGGDGGVAVFPIAGSSGMYTYILGAPGGLGGGLVGGTGGSGNIGSGGSWTTPTGGTGGSQLAPGKAGTSSLNTQYTPPKSAGQPEDGDPFWGGGDGGGEAGGGGGGGGGWYGGGGGGSVWAASHVAAGGGGGSRFGPTGSVFIQGVHSGGGKAIATFTPSPGLVPTTTTVVPSANPATSTQAITFTASVSLKPPAVGAAPGSVRVEVDGVPVGGGPMTLVNGQATSPPITLQPGTHQVLVTYLGNGNLAPSSAVVSQVVTP